MRLYQILAVSEPVTGEIFEQIYYMWEIVCCAVS